MDTSAIAQLQRFIDQNRKLFILTGAGCSTDSGIPAYRDKLGSWLGGNPIQHQEFLDHHHVRQRYWFRSVFGWKVIGNAQPNLTHKLLAEWEAKGRIELLVTQNVDCLHRRAGSRSLLELHGRLDQVVCLNCDEVYHREKIQSELESLNPHVIDAFNHFEPTPGPDGDATFGAVDYSLMEVPSCMSCGGVLKPNVVFFGGNVPREDVQASYAAVEKCDAVVVIGSSLMVYSGYRFCKRAAELNKPIVVINDGRTRADDILSFKLAGDCQQILSKIQITETESN
ncbi:NAD-dependent protein deacetylase [Sessilibacter corallicola]|uniref:NAD-dependent protein deacetylase n=1 Tax=Sessilibacter corallicola TaxID=2904075 RepID=UPI001E3D652A|nr:NAD-dependent protein deacetylase [Sessilibacter corallicola]